MPKQGNSVESCIIVSWKKAVGETVEAGDIVCEVETDKALIEVESPAAGTLLAHFFAEGDEVPVMTNIAAVGQPGEAVDNLNPNAAAAPEPAAQPTPVADAAPPVEPETAAPVAAPPPANGDRLKISPRAKALAGRKQVAPENLSGSGPGGRIIERDVQAAIEARPAMTPLARTMLGSGEFAAPPRGSGVRGRITKDDLTPAATAAATAAAPPTPGDDIEIIPVKGVRKVIAERMLESLQTTAQLTLNSFADARALQAYRKQLKASDPALGLQAITLNDLILLAVSRTLPQFPDLNALFTGTEIHRYRRVHLGMAVDTPRGLMVPTLRAADTLSLKQLAAEAKRLAAACQSGKIAPD
ncbi:MAG: 2-oxo acid dehydrogenase subunit E2, partial [Chloroflexi bacterium]